MECLKKYCKNPNFTTLSGQQNCTVIGSENGLIRFYNNNKMSNSINNLEFSDKVLHLETTKDGKWVLATFEKYLMLIKSLFDNKVP